MTGKEATVRPAHPVLYRCGEARHTFFQVDKVQKQLKAVSQKLEYYLLETLRAKQVLVRCSVNDSGQLRIRKPDVFTVKWMLEKREKGALYQA